MNCTYCEDRLSDYLEETLPAAEQAVVEAHLLSCLACGELVAGLRHVLHFGRDLPEQLPPAWLASRIVANTPQVLRITWRDWFAAAWRNICEPRFALGLLTSMLMLGWLGGMVGITPADVVALRHPSAIYNRMGGWANRLYGDAVCGVYNSPLVNEIQCQIHSRFEQSRENS